MRIVLFLLLFSFSLFAQTPDPLLTSEPSPTTEKTEIEALKKQVQELSEVSAEQAELLKRQIKDQHFDQSSRGYLEIKVGRSLLNPEDVEDENNDLFNDTDDANWDSFDYANILDLEIGKTILGNNGVSHQIGIGYQYLRSKKMQASYTPTAGPPKVHVYETITSHTLFLRYAMMNKISSDNRFYFGPGATIGYAPITELMIEAQRDDEGVQVKAENPSMLIELFGKARYEFTRYFYLVAVLGYRMQEAENIRLSAAEVVSVKTSTDLDLSGFYGTLGFATSF